MNFEIKMEQYRCRICLQYSTETISIHDQIAAGVTYLDITLKPADQLELNGLRDEPLHICVPCANMAKTVYNFQEPCKEADCKLEISEEIIEEKVEAVDFENGNVITFTSNRIKNEDESISNYRDYGDFDFSLKDENNYIKVEPPVDENIKTPSDLYGVNTNSSDFEIIENTENATSNYFACSLKEEVDIKNEKISLEDTNTTIEEASEVDKLCAPTYCRKLRSHSSVNTETVPSNCSPISLKQESDIVSESEQTLETLKNSLRKNNRVVHEPTNLQCDYCEYIPEYPKDYVKHVEAEHADKKTGSKPKIHPCKVCGTKFAWKKGLTRHLRQHKQTCRECGKSYTHLNIWKKIKKCDACSNKAAWTGFACRICNEIFTRSSHLRRHTKSAHDLDKTSCYFCNFLPKHPSELRNHIAQEHADKKTLACKYCDKTYFEPRSLKKHLTSHEKKHTCNICGYKLTSKEMMEKHVSKHAGVFCCAKCNKIFCRSLNLIRHMQKAHKNDSSDEDTS